MREGANLFKATQEKQAVEQPRVAQGFIEDSNVDPVVENCTPYRSPARL